jgi:hypothetical protein
MYSATRSNASHNNTSSSAAKTASLIQNLAIRRENLNGSSNNYHQRQNVLRVSQLSHGKAANEGLVSSTVEMGHPGEVEEVP